MPTLFGLTTNYR